MFINDVTTDFKTECLNRIKIIYNNLFIRIGKYSIIKAVHKR